MLILEKLLLRTPDSIGVSLKIARNGAPITLERISSWRTKSEFAVISEIWPKLLKQLL